MGEKIILYRYYDLYIIICVFCMYILVAIAIRNFLAKGMGLVHQTFTRLVVYLAVLIFLDLF